MEPINAYQLSCEGNAFSRVCLPTGGGGATIQDPGQPSLLYRACTPDMFKLNQDGPHCTAPPPETFKLVHYETCTVSKRAVGILLDCFLV